MGSTGSDSDGRAVGADLAQQILAHHGVKGMKWGVRKIEKTQARADKRQANADKHKAAWDKARAKKGKAPGELNLKKKFTWTQREANAINQQKMANRFQKHADKTLKKVDGKWEKQIYSMGGAVEVHNAMADHFNSRVGAINDRHPDANVHDMSLPATKKYVKDITKLENEGYALAVKSVHGSSPSGKKEAVFVSDEKGQRIEVKDKTVQHAENSEPDLVMYLNVNEAGKVISGNKAELAQAMTHAEVGEAFLEHHGVKGMKWGVRKSDSGSGPVPATVTQKKPGSKLKAKGGEGHPASEEAKRAAENIRVARKSRPDALSNQQLQDAIRRMQLEQQFTALSQGRQNSGARFVKKLLGDTAQDQVRAVAGTQAAFEIDKQLSKHGRPIAAKSKYKFPDAPKT